jgi:hypothetical protein
MNESPRTSTVNITTPFQFDYLWTAAAAQSPSTGTQPYHFVHTFHFRPMHGGLHNLRLRIFSRPLHYCLSLSPLDLPYIELREAESF